jgi:hypothetical protein
MIVPLSAPEIPNPGRGQHEWYDQPLIPDPWPTLDGYRRFTWRELEPRQGEYTFGEIDSELAKVAARGGKFGFRIMPLDSDARGSQVPRYLMDAIHGQLQDGVYVPDWNDPYYLDRARALWNALAARYANDPRLGWVETGPYGDYGEWHLFTVPWATPMNADNKRALIDMVIQAFPNTRIIQQVDDIDGVNYAMSRSPQIGWRADCFGAANEQGYINGRTALLDRWKTAPVLAEFCGLAPGTKAIARAAEQLRTFHVSSIGKNAASWNTYGAADQDAIQQMIKAAGYRIQLDSLTVPSVLVQGSAFTVSTHWENVNDAPPYTPWIIQIQLRDDSGQVAWQGASAFDLRQLLPTGGMPLQVDDTFFSLPTGLRPGAYTVAVQVVDPDGYYAPLRLAIQGRRDDGSYWLGTIGVLPPAPAADVSAGDGPAPDTSGSGG